MGNCQAAEAATVMIQHPGGKVERVYSSVSAREVMGSNPGHYVAVVVTAPPHAAAIARAASATTDGSSAPVRQLKLLRPDDTLHVGRVYRLISFEEVLKALAAKKHVKLSKLLLTQQQQEKKKRDRDGGGRRGRDGTPRPLCENSSAMVEHQQQPPWRREDDDEPHPTTTGASGSSMISLSGGRFGGGATRHGQWRPSLQTIAETGS